MHNVFFALSLILTLLFFLYGFNHYYLLSKARRYKQPVLLESVEFLPSVAIHLPIYNERYVVRRLVDACIHMAEMYGIDKVKVVILDDSTDDTIVEVDRVVDLYKVLHYQIEVIRRENREGFKAGALLAALETTEEDYIAVFDADFIPPADFLCRTMPYFLQDDQIGIIQCRWSHLNRSFNFLTKAVAIAIDIHFMIEQTGRYAAGVFQNFNGSGGLLKKKAIMEAGGWQADTLAEDLDLSYRIQLLGYRVLYLKDLHCPAEIPPTIPSFKRQQGRWACGSLRTAKKILPQLLTKTELGFNRRLQAFIHLTGYMLHPLMTISFVLTCLATIFELYNRQAYPLRFFPIYKTIEISLPTTTSTFQNVTWAVLGPLIFLCTCAPWVSSITTLRMGKFSLFRNLGNLITILLLGFGLSLNNSFEAGKALLSNRIWEFNRTPKYADLQTKSGWQTKTYQVSLNPMWIIELVFACLGILAIIASIVMMNYSVLLILIPFTTGYFFISYLTNVQSRRREAG